MKNFNSVSNEGFKRVFNARGEDQVRAEIKQLFEEIGVIDVKLQVKAGRGRADIVIDSLKIVIETKARNKVDPQASGSGKNENQLKQTERYVRYFAEHKDLFLDNEILWRGFLTDGVSWFSYQWDAENRVLKKLSENNFIAFSQDNISQFNEFLRTTIIPSNRQGKPSPPQDIVTSVLKPRLESLREILEQAQEDHFFQTKINLWEILLRGSGLIPNASEKARIHRIFISHTGLVITARLIIKILTAKENKKNIYLDAIANGFPAWVAENSKGEKWINELGEELNKYDWRKSTRDVLRETYENLIPREERKEFGEYYTPDWVAEKICLKVLDKSWLEASIEKMRLAIMSNNFSEVKGIGVLDPSCGSGTFLFQAAKIIVDYAINKKQLPNSLAADIASRLIYGMDIHPVAVEMSKATLMTALPVSKNVNENSLSVFISDSLKTSKIQGLELERDQDFIVTSGTGIQVTIPKEIFYSPQMSILVEKTVDNAIIKKSPSFAEFNLSEQNQKALAEAQYSIQRIIEREGNHVWAWHIKNAAAPIKIESEKVDRIIGNPPWLVANDTPDGRRKEDIKNMKKAYNLFNKNIKRTSAQGDLASIFSARVVDLYLGDNGKIGFVFPKSALINQTWEEWRKGIWQKTLIQFNHEAWDFTNTNPKPFPHSPNGACVIFGKKVKQLLTQNISFKIWDTKEKFHIYKKPKEQPEFYSNVFRRGALFTPDGLVLSINYRTHNNQIIFSTKKSTKGVWKGISVSGTIEKDGAFPILRSQALYKFCYKIDAVVIAPILCSGGKKFKTVEMEEWPSDWLPELKKYWEKAESIYREKTTNPQGKKIGKGGSSLSENVNYKNSLTNQLNKRSDKSSRKIVYNSSGSILRAARVPNNTLIGNSLYSWIANSENEAAYLVALMNAPSLQKSYVDSKTSKMHFHKRPLEFIPIPQYDNKNKFHQILVEETKRIESIADKKLKPQNEAKEIDAVVKEILPDYHNP